MCIVRFWGVRGSIPTPGPSTVKVGGNTSCVEVRCGDKLFIFDAGTGIRVLGNNLLSELPVKAYLFFSHVHWDHIQGFPFFTPGFIKGNRFELFGASYVTNTLEETLAGQMNYPNFPVTLKAMASEMIFHNITDGDIIRLGSVKIIARALYHPGGNLGYRVEFNNKIITYATDTEPLSLGEFPQGLLEISQDSDLLIHDAQYLPEEYLGEKDSPPKIGWGHSTYVHAIEVAKRCNVKRLVLFHHDPSHDDITIERIEKEAQNLFPQTIAARESLQINL